MSVISPNPALSRGFAATTPDAQSEVMTLEGAVRKSWLLIWVAAASAVLSALALPLAALFPAAIATFILGLVTSFRPHLAPRTALPYAVLDGALVGLVSRLYADEFGGALVAYAVGITAAIFVALLAVYSSRLIKVTQNFRLAVAAATLGLMLYYAVAFVLSFFGVGVPLIASTSIYGIGFSVLVVVLASANLVIDFDFIERGAAEGLPRHMEWYAAFGLLVTLVWLYLELLRLLAKLQSRD
jgi:uncharacterized YccA/Bax inhibitor family protein